VSNEDAHERSKYRTQVNSQKTYKNFCDLEENSEENLEEKFKFCHFLIKKNGVKFKY
jgi:hypothetical protein